MLSYCMDLKWIEASPNVSELSALDPFDPKNGSRKIAMYDKILSRVIIFEFYMNFGFADATSDTVN